MLYGAGSTQRSKAPGMPLPLARTSGRLLPVLRGVAVSNSGSFGMQSGHVRKGDTPGSRSILLAGIFFIPSSEDKQPVGKGSAHLLRQ